MPLEERNNGQNNPLTEEDNKRLSDCQSKLSALQTVKKLAEFADQLDTKNNNSTNILNNLCDGLETFLGFNPESKGYTGQGIVYSDLDRLCDAVMGFLSGVLGAVKDENEVATYDNYITGDNKNLKSVLKLVNTKIGTGREGLAESVAEVREWLEGYGKSLKEKTDNVTGELMKLSKTTINNKISEIKENQPLQNQLSTWTKTVSSVYSEIVTIKTKHISKLDNALKNKINSEMKVVEKAVTMLVQSANNKDLERQVRKVDETLDSEMKNILHQLHMQFVEISKGISNLDKKKQYHFYVINGGLDEASRLLENEFNKDYVRFIIHKFEEIQMEITNVFADVSGEKMELDRLVSDAKREFATLKNGVGYKGSLSTTESSIQTNWNAIRDTIKGLVTQLYNAGNHINPGDLGSIVRGVKEYAGNFAMDGHRNGFDAIIDNWILDILSKNEIIKSWLKSYVDYNQNAGKSSQSKLKITDVTALHSHIISAIKNEIDKHDKIIEAAGQAVQQEIVKADSQSNPADKIADYVSGVQRGCDKFATALEAQFKGGLSRIGNIVTTINDAVKNVDESPYTLDLTCAIQVMLPALITNAKNVGAQFNKFAVADTRLSETMKKAFTKIGQIDEQFKSKIIVRQSHGEKIDRALQDVKMPIDELDILLVEQRGDQVGSIQKKIHEIENVLNKLVNEDEDGSVIINKKKSEAAEKMEELKISLSNKVFDVRHAVFEADTLLQTAINEIRDALNEPRKGAEKAVTSAFQKVTSAVRSLFAKQHEADLLALQTLLVDQTRDIRKLIDHDKNIGVKGLLAKLSTTVNGEDLQRIKKQNLEKSANDVKSFFTTFFNYLNFQSDLTNDRDRLTPLSSALSSLLSAMHENNHFDATVSSKLADLHAALNTLTPTQFSQASPLLNVLKAGVQEFHGELAKQYVSRYSGQTIEWLKPTIPKTTIEELTTDAINCARVFLTAIHILAELMEFNEKCMSPALCKKRIFKRNEDTTLAKYLQNYGYGTPSSTETQDGELRRGLTGMIVGTFLTEEKNGHKLFTYLGKPDGTIRKLYGYLHCYYEVRHLATLSSKKYPSSVYDMLRWLTGLPHNTVFPKVSVGDIGDLFEKPDEASGEGNPDGPLVLQTDPDTLPAYPQTIAASNLSATLCDVCVHAKDVLIGILGHGHADGIYAVDFNTNPDGFSYPTAPGACFDMLCDVLNRLYQQLFFLYSQCSNEEPSVSWRDCWYGNQVGGSDWKCNAMQCANQKGNQIHKQKCNQKCDQTANCGLKSPLQSFLEDGLPGFLPHSFTKPGCKLECTYSNHRGIPCRTPMGFADISVTASHRQTGEYLKKVLKDFCGSESAPLTKLCGQLTCLLQKPPQTLGDIFAFYYGYLEEWANDFYNKPRKPNPYTQVAFNDAVNAAIFGKPYDALNPKILVSSGKHDHTHTKGDLFTIADCTSGSVAPCGLYVKSVTQEIFNYYSSEHQGNHLSWFVYITETFYDLLKKLYDDCCNKCGPTGSKCYTKSCDEKCSVKYTTDKTEQVAAVSTEHQPTCKSIVTCRDTHPTLYKYGFTFGNTIVLNGSRGNRGAKRTCNDFCEALKEMVDKESVIITLRKQIDEFLWQIRLNFSITVLALWLLSFLYLLHIMVIRLDLLHIKSHLHSPSSHRIAAQSLLAAARVNKLGKVFYLQP